MRYKNIKIKKKYRGNYHNIQFVCRKYCTYIISESSATRRIVVSGRDPLIYRRPLIAVREHIYVIMVILSGTVTSMHVSRTRGSGRETMVTVAQCKSNRTVSVSVTFQTETTGY